ncbi:MAG: hypothetical protein AB1698_10975 [Pseudomonadota bacterium]
MKVEDLHGFEAAAVVAGEPRGGGIGIEDRAGFQVDGELRLDAPVEGRAERACMKRRYGNGGCQWGASSITKNRNLITNNRKSRFFVIGGFSDFSCQGRHLGSGTSVARLLRWGRQTFRVPERAHQSEAVHGELRQIPARFRRLLGLLVRRARLTERA